MVVAYKIRRLGSMHSIQTRSIQTRIIQNSSYSKPTKSINTLTQHTRAQHTKSKPTKRSLFPIKIKSYKTVVVSYKTDSRKIATYKTGHLLALK